ncbi:hypothetical protein [Acidaminococcus massiliensis]|nr:hypothetical protein [Acidaminococcus massiliensis]
MKEKKGCGSCCALFAGSLPQLFFAFKIWKLGRLGGTAAQAKKKL